MLSFAIKREEGEDETSAMRKMLLSGLYTSVGATLRGYTVVIPADTTSAPTDYEIPIGIYTILNQNAANPTNQPLKPKTSTLSRSDLIKFE